MTDNCTAEHVLHMYSAFEACQTQTCCNTKAHSRSTLHLLCYKDIPQFSQCCAQPAVNVPLSL